MIVILIIAIALFCYLLIAGMVRDAKEKEKKETEKPSAKVGYRITLMREGKRIDSKIVR